MQNKNLTTFLAFMVLMCAGSAGLAQQDSSVDYSLWAKVLNTYVNDKGRVNYMGLKADSRDLDGFLAIVEGTDVNALSDTEQKTFWINAYNAITLKVVSDAFPKVSSIRHIDFGFVWEKKRNVARSRISLGHIEHKILRPRGDPRIHFGLNCASVGCPELPQKPFYPKTLDEQLENETREFINNPSKVRLDRDSNTLYYSAIFDWFEEDFLKVAPDILSYIKKFINAQDREYLDSHTVIMKAFSYDWSLNKQE